MSEKVTEQEWQKIAIEVAVLCSPRCYPGNLEHFRAMVGQCRKIELEYEEWWLETLRPLQGKCKRVCKAEIKKLNEECVPPEGCFTDREDDPWSKYGDIPRLLPRRTNQEYVLYGYYWLLAVVHDRLRATDSKGRLNDSAIVQKLDKDNPPASGTWPKRMWIEFWAFPTHLSRCLKFDDVKLALVEVKSNLKRLDETRNATPTGKQAQLKPFEEIAYRTFVHALEQEPSLKTSTDKEVYGWIKRNEGRCLADNGYSLPGFDTWQRYLRSGRKFHKEQKNTPRAGRPHGTSIVESGDN